MASAIGEIDLSQEFVRTRDGTPATTRQHRRGNVLEGGQTWHEIERLEHHADLIAAVVGETTT